MCVCAIDLSSNMHDQHTIFSKFKIIAFAKRKFTLVRSTEIKGL